MNRWRWSTTWTELDRRLAALVGPVDHEVGAVDVHPFPAGLGDADEPAPGLDGRFNLRPHMLPLIGICEVEFFVVRLEAKVQSDPCRHTPHPRGRRLLSVCLAARVRFPSARDRCRAASRYPAFVSETYDRPPALRDATVAIAYQRWLVENELSDSDAAAWRFAAEMGQVSLTSETPQRGRPWSVTALIATASAVVMLALIVTSVVSVLTAHHWTKVTEPEQTEIVQVPSGTWHVSLGSKDVCVVKQPYADCISAWVNEWNGACADRTLDTSSIALCDSYYDTIQEMRTNQAADPWLIVGEGSTESQLLRRENTESRTVTVVPEKTREAVCYLGFLGDCPSVESSDSGAFGIEP